MPESLYRTMLLVLIVVVGCVCVGAQFDGMVENTFKRKKGGGGGGDGGSGGRKPKAQQPKGKAKLALAAQEVPPHHHSHHALTNTTNTNTPRSRIRCWTEVTATTCGGLAHRR